MARNVVFIHGMFVTPACWADWAARFTAQGYTCMAPPWPGREGSVASLRARHPDPALGALTLQTVVEHYATLIRGLDSPPVLVGHSMGGLIVQLLLQQGLGSVGVAIDSAPPNGVNVVAWSFLKSNWPVINPFVGAGTPYLMPLSHFVYTFVHTLPAEAQRAAYEQHVVPESRRVGRAALEAYTRVDFAKPHAPLLFIAGTDDRIIPAALNKTNHARYTDGGSVTDFKEFPGRTHYIIGQPGWEEVADHVREWMGRHAG